MELFIQIRNGQPYEHPIFGDNFRQAFPHIDTENLPPEFARFIRIACPNNAGLYEVDQVEYQWSNGVVTDVWSVRPMTDEERIDKDEREKNNVLFFFEQLKQLGEQCLTEADTDIKRAAWSDYLAALDAWTYVDWKQPDFPTRPKQDD